LDGKLRYSVIFAMFALAMTASMPTARVPSRLNNSYAAWTARSRPVARTTFVVRSLSGVSTIRANPTKMW
jgi:hypothetical protein